MIDQSDMHFQPDVESWKRRREEGARAGSDWADTDGFRYWLDCCEAQLRAVWRSLWASERQLKGQQRDYYIALSLAWRDVLRVLNAVAGRDEATEKLIERQAGLLLRADTDHLSEQAKDWIEQQSSPDHGSLWTSPQADGMLASDIYPLMRPGGYGRRESGPDA